MLKDKEAASRHDLQLLLEKHKKLEAAHSEELLTLQSEIKMGNEARHNLETEAQDLRREITLKIVEIKNLKEELKALMDARSELIENLKSSNYNLECKLADKTHELAVLLEKHSRHSVLLEAIEKEAFAIREAVDETNACIQQKEEEVFSFQKNILRLLEFESTFLKRIDYLEQQLKLSSRNLNEKSEIIVALEKKLEAIDNDHTVEVERAILQESLETKDNLILMLRQEKEVLIENLNNYETTMERLQTSITQEDQIVVKYQQEVMALQKDLDMMRNSLTKTEQSLIEAAEDNKKLRDEIQDQKQSFATQAAQLWEDAKVALETKIHELESKVIEKEHLLQKKLAGIKQRITKRYQDSCSRTNFAESNNAIVHLKAASTRDVEIPVVISGACPNCHEDNMHNQSKDSMNSPWPSEYISELDQGSPMSCSRPIESFSNLEDHLPCGLQLDQTSHLLGGTNHVSKCGCNKETARGFLREGKESGPWNVDLCGHTLNSQPVKHPEGGNSLNINSILERLGRPQVKTKGKPDPLEVEVMPLERPKVFTQEGAKMVHKQGDHANVPLQRLDNQEQIMMHSKPGSKPPIASEQTPTMELNNTSNKDVPACEFDKQQQEKTPPELDTQLLLSESPKPLKKQVPWIVLDKENNEEATPKRESDVLHQERTHLQSKEQPMLLEIPKLPSLMASSESECDETEASAEEANVQQQQEQIQCYSELQLMIPGFTKLSRQMPTVRLNEPDNGQKPSANKTLELQDMKIHPSFQAELTLLEHPELSDEPNDGIKSSANETDKQQQNETWTDSELHKVSMQEHGMDIFPPVCFESVLASDVPPSASPSKINPGKEGLPLEAADEATPQNNINIKERKSVIQVNSSGLVVQFRPLSTSQTETRSTKKKASVPTSASECFCNMPPYGYMVKCKGCGTHFHAACIQLEEVNPGESYTCASCKEQPNRKRRQVQILK